MREQQPNLDSMRSKTSFNCSLPLITRKRTVNTVILYVGIAVFSIVREVAQQRWVLAQFKMSEFSSVSFLIVDFSPLIV